VPCKAAEAIEMQCGTLIHVDTMIDALDRGTYRRHLANTIKMTVLGGDAGCRFLM